LELQQKHRPSETVRPRLRTVSGFSVALSFCSPVWGSCVELESNLGRRTGTLPECCVHIGFRIDCFHKKKPRCVGRRGSRWGSLGGSLCRGSGWLPWEIKSETGAEDQSSGEGAGYQIDWSRLRFLTFHRRPGCETHGVWKPRPSPLVWRGGGLSDRAMPTPVFRR
jgi:hypothetical protein